MHRRDKYLHYYYPEHWFSVYRRGFDPTWCESRRHRSPGTSPGWTGQLSNALWAAPSGRRSWRNLTKQAQHEISPLHRQTSLLVRLRMMVLSKFNNEWGLAQWNKNTLIAQSVTAWMSVCMTVTLQVTACSRQWISDCPSSACCKWLCHSVKNWVTISGLRFLPVVAG